MKRTAANQWAWVSETGRPEAEKTVKTFLREVAEAGYDAVEFFNAEHADRIAEYGLSVCGAYANGPFHDPWSELDAEARFMGTARQLAEQGGHYVAVNCDPKGAWADRERKTEDDLRRQGENLSRLARDLAPLGLRLVMHNHANRSDLHLDDLRSVTEFADPIVGVCLDTGWSLTSEDEPVARARALGPRLGALHLRNQRGDVPTEWLGEGDMDTAAFFAVLGEIGYSGWLTTELWHRADTHPRRSLLDDQRRTVVLMRELAADA